VIERIERLNLDENSSPYQSTKKPRTYHKAPPKWLIKTLESVCLDEVGKKRTRSSTRQDGGDVDSSNLGDVDDMNISYDFESNLSNNFEPTSFEDVASHDE
jgi:hypothetical protein